MKNNPIVFRCAVIVCGVALGLACAGLSGCEKEQPQAGGAANGAAGKAMKDQAAGESNLPSLPERPAQHDSPGAPSPEMVANLKMAGRPITPASAPTTRRAPDGVPARPSSYKDDGDASVAVFAGLVAPKPATWQWHQPASTMRVAEYTVPGVEGSDQAQIVVYQFRGGGTVEANVERWKSQFRRADGSAVEPKMQEIEADGMKVTVAEFSGEYKGMNQMDFAPDQTLVAAIVESGADPVFVQLVGPSKTVAASHDAFMAMLRGMKKSEPMK